MSNASSKAPKKRQKRSLSTGSLKSLLVAGSATATFLGATMIAKGDAVAETAVPPPPPSIIIQETIIVDPLVEGETAVIIDNSPIPQVIIPEPVTTSQSSR